MNKDDEEYDAIEAELDSYEQEEDDERLVGQLGSLSKSEND